MYEYKGVQVGRRVSAARVMQSVHDDTPEVVLDQSWTAGRGQKSSVKAAFTRGRGRERSETALAPAK